MYWNLTLSISKLKFSYPSRALVSPRPTEIELTLRKHSFHLWKKENQGGEIKYVKSCLILSKEPKLLFYDLSQRFSSKIIENSKEH